MIYYLLSCQVRWFFSSWEEDVNVPVNEEAGQISGLVHTLREQCCKLGQCPRDKLTKKITSLS